MQHNSIPNIIEINGERILLLFKKIVYLENYDNFLMETVFVCFDLYDLCTYTLFVSCIFFIPLTINFIQINNFRDKLNF